MAHRPNALTTRTDRTRTRATRTSAAAFRTRTLALVAIVLGGLIAWTLPGCWAVARPPEKETVTIQGHTFTLAVADDEASRTKGMGGVPSVDEFGGMIFIFPDSELRSFWMYDCVVDLDIIFLDDFGRITAMHTMPAEPLRGPDESQFEYEIRLSHYSSNRRARFAIELAAGWLDRLDLKVQDKIELDLERLKARALPAEGGGRVPSP